MNQLSEAMIDQIFSMRENGLSISAISRSLGVSRNTIKRYLRGEKQPARKTPSQPSLSRNLTWAKALDWDLLTREYASGTTLKQLHVDHEIPISYGQFARHMKARMPKTPPSASPALRHEPGERTQVDYCDGIPIYDRRTGKARKTHFFCGVLPFSSKTFGEFSWNQKLPSFIRSHEKMWAYFGGVTPYVVIDNLKSGVTKAHRFDPDINPTYCDYGNHSGFAVLPARPRTPRDKAAVESAIGAIQRDFFQQVRGEKFYSLEALNSRFRIYLDKFNDRVMKDFGVSRNERFAKERELLRSLPNQPYEIFEWKEAKVHPDCCIQVAKAFYSVPYHLVGQTVRVKVTDTLVIIFKKDMEEVASHPRCHEHKRSVRDEHFPHRGMQVSSFEVQRCQQMASSIGSHTLRYVEWQFDISRPLAALRRVLGVLRLCKTNKIPREAMEFAACQALQFSRRELRYFEQCAMNFQKNGGKPQPARPPARDIETLNLHNIGEENHVRGH